MKSTKKQHTKNIFKIMWNQIKRVPWYGWAATLFLNLLEPALYAASSAIYWSWSRPWAISPVIMSIDGRMPLIPYFWAQIYLLYRVPMVIAPLIISTINKEHFINYFFAYLSALLIGFLIFAFCPSDMDRTNMPGIGNVFDYIKDKSGWSWQILNYIYKHDGNKIGHNLFPSFHVLNSFFMWYGMTRRKEIKIGYRIGWLTLSILVILSTLFLRQHFLFDVLTAILLGLATSWIIKFINVGQRLLNKYPNFLIIKKLNWTNEQIKPIKSKTQAKQKKRIVDRGKIDGK